MEQDKKQDKKQRTKEKIRKQFLQRRNAMESGERMEAGGKIKERVLLMKRLTAAETIFLYAACKSEVPTRKLIQELLASGKKVALPKVDGKRMDFYEIASWEGLLPGYQGILEPQTHEAVPVLPCESDVMLLPGAVFDKKGGRIGYGGGYYDRYLWELEETGRKQPYLIGICYHKQLWKGRLPMEPHDVRVNSVVTEKKAIDTDRARHGPKWAVNAVDNIVEGLIEGVMEFVLELLFGLFG